MIDEDTKERLLVSRDFDTVDVQHVNGLANRRRRERRRCGRARHQHGYALEHQFGYKHGQAVIFALGRAIQKGNVTTFDVAMFGEALAECRQGCR